MIYIAAFTEKGTALGKTLAKGLEDTFVFAPERFAGEGVAAFGGPIQQWTEQAFQQVKGLIFRGLRHCCTCHSPFPAGKRTGSRHSCSRPERKVCNSSFIGPSGRG